MPAPLVESASSSLRAAVSKPGERDGRGRVRAAPPSLTSETATSRPGRLPVRRWQMRRASREGVAESIHVDHAVVLREFGALKTVRRLRMVCSVTRGPEADQARPARRYGCRRAWRKGRDAAGRGMGQHDDVRQRIAHPARRPWCASLIREGCLPACARAAGGGEIMNSVSRLTAARMAAITVACGGAERHP